MQEADVTTLLPGDTHTTNIVSDRKNFIMSNLRNNLHANPATSTRTSPSTRIKISAAVAACLAFSACGAITEKVTEKGAERIIESQTDGKVDLDFNSGNGSFSVQTEEGGFAISEDGTFVVTDQDGSVFTGSASDDGVVVRDGEGKAVLDASGADGGNLTIQGEDGESVYRMLTEVPAEWPADVPRPAAMAVEGGTYMAGEGEVMISVVGAPTSGDALGYVETYAAALESSGMSETGRYDTAADGSKSAMRTFEGGSWTVNINGYDEPDSSIVNIVLMAV